MVTAPLYKVVSALPSTLVADAIYAVRQGDGFDLYITDVTGAAKPLNSLTITTVTTEAAYNAATPGANELVVWTE